MKKLLSDEKERRKVKKRTKELKIKLDRKKKKADKIKDVEK